MSLQGPPGPSSRTRAREAGADDLTKTGKIHELSDDELTEVAGGKVHVQVFSITKWVDRISPKLFVS
jgi:type VI protein secretion system component Hcp